jgi:hypothetical protein
VDFIRVRVVTTPSLSLRFEKLLWEKVVGDPADALVVQELGHDGDTWLHGGGKW